MPTSKEELQEEIAKVFLKHTRVRSWDKGYKRWEIKIMSLCGYVYEDEKGFYKENADEQV